MKEEIFKIISQNRICESPDCKCSLSAQNKEWKKIYTKTHCDEILKNWGQRRDLISLEEGKEKGFIQSIKNPNGTQNFTLARIKVK